MPADASYTGKERFDFKGIDSCIADIVEALNKSEIWTAGSCCGHGKGPGYISLHDGRHLIIKRLKGKGFKKEVVDV